MNFPEEMDGAFRVTWYGGLRPNILDGLRSFLRVHVSIRALFPGGVLAGSFWSLGSRMKGAPEFS